MSIDELKAQIAQLKAEKKELETKAKAEKQAKASYSRFDAIAAAVKSGLSSKKDILAEADRLYAENGGKSNAKETAWAFNSTRAALVAFGLAVADKDTFTLSSSKPKSSRKPKTDQPSNPSTDTTNDQPSN